MDNLKRKRERSFEYTEKSVLLEIVTQMGTTNIRLWKYLGITPTKTSFEHPVSGEQIYMFADVPHLFTR